MRELLEQIWGSAIKEYEKGTICSERHLQSELFRLLKQKFEGTDKQVWVEPVIQVDVRTYRIPDLIITNGKLIEAVIELKYVPYYFASTADIKKLAEFAQIANLQKIHALLTVPATGQWNKEENDTFHWANQPQFVFGVICKKGADALIEKVWQTAGFTEENFIHLTHAVSKFDQVSKEERKLFVTSAFVENGQVTIELPDDFTATKVRVTIIPDE